MEPNREPATRWPEHNCKIDGCRWEHMYGWMVCRYCGTDIPKDMTPAWMEE